MPQRRIVVAATKSRDHVSVIAIALPLIGECNGDCQTPKYVLHTCMYELKYLRALAYLQHHKCTYA